MNVWTLLPTRDNSIKFQLFTKRKETIDMRKWTKILAVMLSAAVALGGMAIPPTSVQAAAAHTAPDCGGHGRSHVVMDKYTGAIKNKVADNILGYTITDTSVYNKVTQQQYINGYFYNASDMYHIMDMEGTEIVVQDLKGNKLFEMADADYSEIEELVLPPRTKVEFNAAVYSPQWVAYDLSKIEAFVVYRCCFEECGGEGCTVCGGPVTKKTDTSSTSAAGASESKTLCFSCNGSGECTSCNGKGWKSIGSNGRRINCSLCKENPGACWFCNGKGEVTIEIKPGSGSSSGSSSRSSSSSYYGYDDDFDDGISDNLDTRYKCTKCKNGKCSNCDGKGRKYDSMCMLCMGNKKCCYCGGDGWVDGDEWFSY